MYKRQEILPNVFLTNVQSEKFKTGCLSISLLRPLLASETSSNALIPTVLLRGCKDYPDMQAISAFLDTNYGASVGTLVRKKGEVQVVGFYADFLEDAFALEGEGVLGNMIDFLGQLLLQPVLENNAFVSDFVEGEKINLINAIEARINDKRSYTTSQMIKTMCKDELFGVSRLGEVENVELVDGVNLYAQYLNVLEHSQVEIFYHGRCPEAELMSMMTDALKTMPRGTIDPVSTHVVPKATQVQYPRLALDVTQGKLSMGLRTNMTAVDKEYPALLLLNAVFGAGVTSKLFLNVREKLSLCYYASSSLEKFKGLMLISSGVEFDKYEIARDEILAQLDGCRAGDITEQELETARISILSSLKAGMDSPGRLDDYALGQSILGAHGTMMDLAKEIGLVTKEDVAAAAREITLDTVCFLEGLKQ